MVSVAFYIHSRPRIQNSESKFFGWSCLKLRCPECFLNIPSLLTCPKTDLAFGDALITWEVWGKQDISAAAITAPSNPGLLDATFGGCLVIFSDCPTARQFQNARSSTLPLGVPLSAAPALPRIKSTWITKTGTLDKFFMDFLSQMLQTFTHKQLDHLCREAMSRAKKHITRESKTILAHCDFSQVSLFYCLTPTHFT
jgi:hypothetical protein